YEAALSRCPLILCYRYHFETLVDTL
ncbi:hypothetical protein NGA_0693100, partial [Nannochloropsis gaditana CCMP526]